MRQAVATTVRRPSIPRGWALLGLALGSWALVIVGGQMVGALFNYISSSI